GTTRPAPDRHTLGTERGPGGTRRGGDRQDSLARAARRGGVGMHRGSGDGRAGRHGAPIRRTAAIVPVDARLARVSSGPAARRRGGRARSSLWATSGSVRSGAGDPWAVG